jgi:hypothetical protein
MAEDRAKTGLFHESLQAPFFQEAFLSKFVYKEFSPLNQFVVNSTWIWKHCLLDEVIGFLSIDLILPAALGPGVYSASNDYQELIK